MQDPSEAYRNAAHIPGGAEYPARWAQAAAAFRAAHPPRVIPYGPGERQRIDLYEAPGAPGTVVFVHGGYWRAFDRSVFSHLAAGALARVWSVAMPSYDLCPGVRIAAITRQIARAVEALSGPLLLTGHSAGGHLVARMGCADVAPRADIRAILPISPLSDLTPLIATDLNADLRLDAAEALDESPVTHPRPACPVHVWVGGAERPAFLDQARWLSEAWRAPLTVAPGRHHFDVIEGLQGASTPLTDALFASAGAGTR